MDVSEVRVPVEEGFTLKYGRGDNPILASRKSTVASVAGRGSGERRVESVGISTDSSLQRIGALLPHFEAFCYCPTPQCPRCLFIRTVVHSLPFLESGNVATFSLAGKLTFEMNFSQRPHRLPL